MYRRIVYRTFTGRACESRGACAHRHAVLIRAFGAIITRVIFALDWHLNKALRMFLTPTVYTITSLQTICNCYCSR